MLTPEQEQKLAVYKTLPKIFEAAGIPLDHQASLIATLANTIDETVHATFTILHLLASTRPLAMLDWLDHVKQNANLILTFAKRWCHD